MTVRTIDEIFRDFVTDGVPASGPFNPHKPDIRDTLKALTEGSENFPDNRVIRLNNADEGTANNIVVTASVAIPAAAYQVLYILNVTQENTGPVTVSGAINRTLVTNTSRSIEPGYLQPGMALLCIDTGTDLRLLSYGDAEAVAQAAEDAAERAEAAAAGLNLPVIQPGDAGKSLIVNDDEDGYELGSSTAGEYESRAKVEETNIPETASFLRTAGYYTAGDGGGALYKRVPAEPDHSAKIQSADGAWWEYVGGAQNRIVGAFFRNDDNFEIDLFTSIDGVSFSRLNQSPLPALPGWGSGEAFVGGPSVGLTFHKGECLIPIGYYDDVNGLFDFKVHRSKNLIDDWSTVECNFGPTPIYNETTPLPGGVVPPDTLWAPKFFKDGADNLYITLSVRYGANFNDVNGDNIKSFRLYYAKCNSVANLTFDAPLPFNFGEDATARIDSQVYFFDGIYYLLCKNEYSKQIEIWMSAAIEGEFTLVSSLSFSVGVDAPSLVRMRKPDGTIFYRCYADAYFNGFYRFKDSSDLITWSDEGFINSSVSLKHGDVINTYDNPEASLIDTALKELAVRSGSVDQVSIRKQVELPNGSYTLTPDDDTLYYVTGSNICTLTLSSRASRRFYLACLSGNPSSGIKLTPTPVFPASGQSIGFGITNDRFVEARLGYGEGANYYLVGGSYSHPAQFRAYKNGTSQTVSSGVSTQVTFPVSQFNFGGVFANSEVTPPVGGRMRLEAMVFIESGISDATNLTIQIRDANNSVVAQSTIQASGTGTHSLRVGALIAGDGIMKYSVWVELFGPGDKIINGAMSNTSFEGWLV